MPTPSEEAFVRAYEKKYGTGGIAPLPATSVQSTLGVSPYDIFRMATTNEERAKVFRTKLEEKYPHLKYMPGPEAMSVIRQRQDAGLPAIDEEVQKLLVPEELQRAGIADFIIDSNLLNAASQEAEKFVNMTGFSTAPVQGDLISWNQASRLAQSLVTGFFWVKFAPLMAAFTGVKYLGPKVLTAGEMAVREGYLADSWDALKDGKVLTSIQTLTSMFNDEQWKEHLKKNEDKIIHLEDQLINSVNKLIAAGGYTAWKAARGEFADPNAKAWWEEFIDSYMAGVLPSDAIQVLAMKYGVEPNTFGSFIRDMGMLGVDFPGQVAVFHLGGRIYAKGKGFVKSAGLKTREAIIKQKMKQTIPEAIKQGAATTKERIALKATELTAAGKALPKNQAELGPWLKRQGYADVGNTIVDTAGPVFPEGTPQKALYNNLMRKMNTTKRLTNEIGLGKMDKDIVIKQALRGQKDLYNAADGDPAKINWTEVDRLEDVIQNRGIDLLREKYTVKEETKIIPFKEPAKPKTTMEMAKEIERRRATAKTEPEKLEIRKLEEEKARLEKEPPVAEDEVMKKVLEEAEIEVKRPALTLEPVVTAEKLEKTPTLADYVIKRPEIHSEKVLARAKALKAKVEKPALPEEVPLAKEAEKIDRIVLKQEAKTAAETRFLDMDKITQDSKLQEKARPSLLNDIVQRDWIDNLKKTWDKSKLTPIVVNRRTVAKGFPASEKDKLVVMDGNHRVVAARELGEKGLDAVIQEVSPAKELEIAIEANNRRLGISKLDLGEQAETYPSIKDAAEKLGKSRTEIKEALDLNALSPAIKQRVREGSISEEKTIVLGKYSRKHDIPYNSQEVLGKKLIWGEKDYSASQIDNTLDYIIKQQLVKKPGQSQTEMFEDVVSKYDFDKLDAAIAKYKSLKRERNVYDRYTRDIKARIEKIEKKIADWKKEGKSEEEIKQLIAKEPDVVLPDELKAQKIAYERILKLQKEMTDAEELAIKESKAQWSSEEKEKALKNIKASQDVIGKAEESPSLQETQAEVESDILFDEAGYARYFPERNKIIRAGEVMKPEKINLDDPDLPAYLRKKLKAEARAMQNEEVKKFKEPFTDPAVADVITDNIEIPILDTSPQYHGKTEMEAIIEGSPKLSAAAEKAGGSAVENIGKKKKTFIGIVIQRFLKQMETVFKGMGDGGKEIIRREKIVQMESEIRGARAMERMIKSLEKIPEKLRKKYFAPYAEAYGGEGAPSEIVKAVEIWREIYTDIGERYVKAGGEKSQRDPNTGKILTSPWFGKKDYYPHKLDINIFKEGAAREAAAQRLVDKGQARSIEEGKTMIDEYLSNKGDRRFGQLEFVRELDFDGYEMDPLKVLPGYILKAERRIAELRHFGKGDKIIKELLDQIRVEGGDANLAKQMFERMVGVKSEWARTRESAYRGIRAFQVITKMGLSQLANATQSLNTMLVTNARSTLGGLRALFTKEGKQFARESGIMLNQAAREFLNTGSWGQQFLKWTGFLGVEKMNLVIAANAGRNFAMRTFKKLLKNPKNAEARYQLEKLGIDVDIALKRGRLEQADLTIAARSVAEEAQFPYRSIKMGFWWTSPEGQLFLQFKSFAYRQSIMLKKHVWNEAKRGNMRPLLTLLITFPIAGELVNDIRAVLRGKERPSDDLKRLYEDFVVVGSLGIFMDLVESAAFSQGRLMQFLAGPTISDVTEITSNAGKLVTKVDPVPLLRSTIRRIPVAGPTFSNLTKKQKKRKFRKGRKKIK